jgi:cytoskeletal protein RodZ
MENLGEFLRNEREKKNITLEQIAKDTKISKGVLFAIESNSFEDLPGGFFNIGILRTYARYIGVNENTVIPEYKRRYERKEEKTFLNEFTKEKIVFPFNKKKIIIIFLSFLAVLLLIWLFYPSGISSKEVIAFDKTGKKQSTEKKQNKKSHNNVKDIRGKAPTINTPLVLKTEEKQTDESIKTINIALHFNNQCWIEIKKREKIIVSKLFFAGQSFLANGDNFDIKLGDPTVVQFLINGKKAVFNSKPGIPLTIKLNISNYKQYIK